jgi:hypothetical protein
MGPRGMTALMAIALLAPRAPHALAACTISGDFTIECDGVTYRAVDDEAVYFVDLAEHNANHPGVPLPTPKKTIAQNYADPAVINITRVALVDYVDCTQTDHNFSDVNIIPEIEFQIPGTGQWVNTNPHPNPPSRLMFISGKWFRVTAAPDDGFATYYYSYDVATSGQAGDAHVLIAELSNDQERYTSLVIHNPDPVLMDPQANTPPWADWGWAPPYESEPDINPWGGEEWWSENYVHTQQGPVFAPDVGVTTYTGRELPIDNQPFLVSLIFHAKSTVARIAVTSTGCNEPRTSTDGGAVANMWVFRMVDPMGEGAPQMTPPTNPAEERRIGIYMTHPWYLYAHYGTPVRTLAQRLENGRRMLAHLRFCGLNYLAFNAINGSDRSEKAWYQGSSYFDWNEAGDLLAELPPLAEEQGVQVLPVITSLQKTPTNGLTVPSEAYQIGSDGDYVRSFGAPALDPLHPDVQQRVFTLLTEIAQRVQHSPAVPGIGLRLNGKLGTCYVADQDGWDGAKKAGYSQWDLQQFNADTGRGAPTSPPSTAYSWLVSRPTEWEWWIGWRCYKTREFWLACRDLLHRYRNDWVLFIQCDLPSEVPGTNREWPTESPYNLLRHHGYDPNLFVDDTGILISRGMMVATDRFYTGSRWNAPWGSNHTRYRTFHYATGLPELYRTAQGRACEMYQNYWEEARNPYIEYGWPTDPGGYFRTTTPAAFGRYFFDPPVMSLRRQDPDTMVWLGWNRPTLGEENRLRKFAQAFRALPAVEAVPFDGTIDPVQTGVVARWYRNRLAVINDTSSDRTITLHFASPVPAGEELANVVTGEKLVAADQTERQHVSFDAEKYSLSTFLYSLTPPSPPSAFDATVHVMLNTQTDITLDAVDEGLPDPPAAMTFVITTLPAHGVLSDPLAGAITATPYTLDGNGNVARYTPNPDFAGPDLFQFKARDGGTAPQGGDSAEATVSIDVSECLFGETFARFDLDAATWPTTGGQPEVDYLALGEPSQPLSLHLDGDPTGGDIAESRAIDLTGRRDMELVYSYEAGGGFDVPNPGRDLIIEAKNNAGQWIEVSRQVHEGAGMTGFQERVARLPYSTGHADFRIRIRNIGYPGPYDTWFVDDICLRQGEPLPRDFDRDGDVDLTDYGFLLYCYNGPGAPPASSNCDAADFDADGDVDLSDYGEFLSCYNGPNRPPACE